MWSFKMKLEQLGYYYVENDCAKQPDPLAGTANDYETGE